MKSIKRHEFDLIATGIFLPFCSSNHQGTTQKNSYLFHCGQIRNKFPSVTVALRELELCLWRFYYVRGFTFCEQFGDVIRF